MDWKVLTIIIAALLFFQGNSVIYSALRMCDSESCDIDLLYTNFQYNLTIPNAYLRGNSIVTFCYRPRSVKNDTNGTCDL